MADNFLDSNGLLYLWSKIKSYVASAISNKVDKVTGKGLSTNDYTTAEKNKLTGITAGAQPNQNAFANIKVGSTTVAADAASDTLELIAGANVTLTPDATNDKVTIAAKDTTYSGMKGASASAAGAQGLVPAPAAGKENSLLTGAGTWDDVSLSYAQGDTGTGVNLFIGAKQRTAFIPEATSRYPGLMSPAEKEKLSAFDYAYKYALKSDITNMYRYKGSVASVSALPTTGMAAGDTYNIDASSSYGPAGTNVAWTGSAWDALGGLLEITAITNAEIDSICV